MILFVSQSINQHPPYSTRRHVLVIVRIQDPICLHFSLYLSLSNSHLSYLKETKVRATLSETFDVPTPFLNPGENNSAKRICLMESENCDGAAHYNLANRSSCQCPSRSLADRCQRCLLSTCSFPVHTLHMTHPL